MRNPITSNPRDRSNQRKALIDELHFTYKQLLRMLPALSKRVDADRVGSVLSVQCEQDRRNQARLVQLAMDHGQPPGPRLCADASARIHHLYHVDRSIDDRSTRGEMVLNSLLDLRVHIMGVWERLLDVEPLGVAADMHEELVALHHAAVDQHQELVRSITRLRDPELALSASA